MPPVPPNLGSRLHYFSVNHIMRANAKKYVYINCEKCGNSIHKEKKEYDRRRKHGKNVFYCSLACHCKSSIGRLDEYSPFRNYVSNSRFVAKTKKISFNLTNEYLKKLWESQNGICPYTHLKMELSDTKMRRIFSPIAASLDRIVPEKGYIEGNVEFVCLSINYSKNVFSKEQIISFISEIKAIH